MAKTEKVSGEARRISVERGAAVLGVSPFTLRKWIRERRLPYHRVGRRLVLDAPDLERFFQGCRVQAREDRR